MQSSVMVLYIAYKMVTNSGKAWWENKDTISIYGIRHPSYFRCIPMPTTSIMPYTQTHTPSELLPHSSFEFASGPRESFYQHPLPYLGVKYIHHISRAYQPLTPLPYLGPAPWMVISLLPRSNTQLESVAETPVLGEASSSKKQWNCQMTFTRKCWQVVSLSQFLLTK